MEREIEEKKQQKRLGNKGFSLVELIVVIAIMAILVGVLAPVLIKNIDKSRESKDLQNLDSVRQAVVTAIADETAFNEIGTGKNVTFDTLPTDIHDSALEILGSVPAMSSKAGKNAKVYVYIDANGSVVAYAHDSEQANHQGKPCNYTDGATLTAGDNGATTAAP